MPSGVTMRRAVAEDVAGNFAGRHFAEVVVDAVVARRRHDAVMLSSIVVAAERAGVRAAFEIAGGLNFVDVIDAGAQIVELLSHGRRFLSWR